MKVFLSAGEPSGDVHGSNLIRAIRARQPDAQITALGGPLMRTAGAEGAHVYQTLRSKADSLRDQIRVETLAQSKIRTNKLDIPAAALILVLLVLIGYPFLIRLFTP